MDIAIILDRLVPGVAFGGSTTDNTESCFDAVVWQDERPKPTWQDMEEEWVIYAAELALLKEFKIYNFVLNYGGDKKTLPLRIDFLTGLTVRLHPKHTFVFGELTQTIYYESAVLQQDGTLVYSNPIVQESFVYTRDEVGFPIQRVNSIRWYATDGTLDSRAKVLEKFYVDDAISTLNELARRRDNNIKNVIGAIIRLALMTNPGIAKADILEQGRQFFYGSSGSRDLYIQDGNPALIQDVRDESTISWFNSDIQAIVGLPTIRAFIIYQLSMGETAV